MEQTTPWLAYGAFGLYSLLLISAAIYDAWRFIIPNTIPLALAVLFVATALVPSFDTQWFSHLGAAGVVFLGTLLLWKFNHLGGGDAKLLTVLALWSGFDTLPQLIFYVIFAGGALAFLLIVLRRTWLGVRRMRPALEGVRIQRVFRVGEYMPYGAAIAPISIFLGTQFPHLSRAF